MLEILRGLAEPTFALGLAVVLHSAGGPELAEKIGRRWRLANKDWQRAGWLLEHWDDLPQTPAMPWSRLQPLLIHDGIAELLALGDALAALGELPAETVAFCRSRLALPPHELNPPPLATGDDLLARGIPRGKRYSRLLHEVRSAQLDGRVRTKEDALDLAESLWKSS
jgi:poly(A) polymerase